MLTVETVSGFWWIFFKAESPRNAFPPVIPFQPCRALLIKHLLNSLSFVARLRNFERQTASSLQLQFSSISADLLIAVRAVFCFTSGE